MQALKAKGRGKSRVSGKALALAAAAVAGVVIVVSLCISISNYRNIHGRYTAARSQLGEAVYQNLFLMLRRGEELTLPGADVQGQVLPAMEEYFAVASALDASLQESYGARYAVLSTENREALQSAFGAYQAALKGGLSTDGALAQMTAALEQTQATLAERFDDAGHLKPGL